MSVDKIIDALKKMTTLHKSLTAIATNKTDIIKKGDMEALQKTLREENKHIAAIQQIEKLLIKGTTEFLQAKGVQTESPKLSDVIEVATTEEKELLINEKELLDEQIKRLKQQNDLNQQLLEQSLQFVQLSLDLLQPDIEMFNYDRSDDEGPKQVPNRSVFDSKA